MSLKSFLRREILAKELHHFEVGETQDFEISDTFVSFFDPIATSGSSVDYELPPGTTKAALRIIKRPTNRFRKNVFVELRFREPSKASVRVKDVPGTIGVDAGTIAISAVKNPYNESIYDTLNDRAGSLFLGMLYPGCFLINNDDGGYGVYEVRDGEGVCGLVLDLANFEPYSDDEEIAEIEWKSFFQDYMKWSWMQNV
jgi:hypothetical protein